MWHICYDSKSINNLFSLTVRESTLDVRIWQSDVYRRQIMTSQVDSRAVGVKWLPWVITTTIRTRSTVVQTNTLFFSNSMFGPFQSMDSTAHISLEFSQGTWAPSSKMTAELAQCQHFTLNFPALYCYTTIKIWKTNSKRLRHCRQNRSRRRRATKARKSVEIKLAI